jgi:hydrogenase 3 maturation protease
LDNTFIMCIGNRDGGYDEIRPYIADTMKKVSQNDTVFDCEITPENFVEVVRQKKPKTLILIDAAEMKLLAGEICIISKEKLGTIRISTYRILLSVLITYLEQKVENIIDIELQPKRMSGSMNNTVKKKRRLPNQHLEKEKIRANTSPLV